MNGNPDEHYFLKINGEWVCECGEKRDKLGYIQYVLDLPEGDD